MSPLSEPKIRVLIVDDHPLVRKGIEFVLAGESDMEMAGEAGDGEEAIEKFQACRPDVVLMDLRMPKIGGVEAARRLRQLDPEVRIIALTSYDGDQDIYRALEVGMRGYILKGAAHMNLGNAIRAVNSGRRSLPSEVAERLGEHFPRVALTPREVEVLTLVAGGLSNKEIARTLTTAIGTIKMHVQNIHKKLGAADRTQAVTIALERGILHLPFVDRRTPMAKAVETSQAI
jgi:DNA-binding NarL/FixJ family response regulator